MWATDAVDAPMPLNKAHRVPGHVEIDDISALLEVDTLGQHIGCYENVIEVRIASRGASVDVGAKP
jgi:hypothetical protein